PEARTFEVERRGAHPMSDAGFTQQGPRKFLARVLLARGRDVGVSQDAIGGDRPAPGDDRPAQRDDRRSLTQRKIRIAELMTWIDDLDSDRAGIDVGLACPG